MTDLDTPLRLSDLLELQGQQVTEPALKRLRRLIAARERELGTRLIMRPCPGAPYHTSLSVLRAHMPELFPRTDPGPVLRTLRELQEELDEMREALKRRDSDTALLRQELAELRARDEALLAEIIKLRRTSG